MEYDQIKRLIEDMGKSNLTSINIEFPNGLKVNMEKNNENKSSSNFDKEIKDKNENNSNVNKEEKIDKNIDEINRNNCVSESSNKNIHIVKSPMVGTFYSKSSPTAEEFVEVGAKVKQGDTLCIIEAMKLMNEIESEFAGKISKILVKNETPVEYGTPLFEIED